jgi:hypothetical protein
VLRKEYERFSYGVLEGAMFTLRKTHHWNLMEHFFWSSILIMWWHFCAETRKEEFVMRKLMKAGIAAAVAFGFVALLPLESEARRHGNWSDNGCRGKSWKEFKRWDKGNRRWNKGCRKMRFGHPVHGFNHPGHGANHPVYGAGNFLRRWF